MLAVSQSTCKLLLQAKRCSASGAKEVGVGTRLSFKAVASTTMANYIDNNLVYKFVPTKWKVDQRRSV